MQSITILPSKNPIDQARHWQYKALKKYQKGDNRKALKYLKRAHVLDRRNEYILEIAKIYEEMGKHKKAYAWISAIKATDQNSSVEKVTIQAWKALIATNYGLRMQALSGYDEAINVLEREGLDSMKLESTLRTNYGVTRCFNQSATDEDKARLIHRRDFQQAYEYFDKAVQLDSSNCTARYNRMVVETILNIDPKLVKYGYVGDSLIQRLDLPDMKTFCIPPPPPPNATIVQKLNIPKSEILFVVDISGSMSYNAPTGNSRLHEAKKVITDLTYDLHDSIEIGLLTVGGSCDSAPISIPPGHLSRSQLREVITHLEADGGTPLNNVLQLSKTKFSENAKAKTIFLCTDGIDGCGGSTCMIAEELLREDIKVHAFSLLLESSKNDEVFAIANCLSQTTGGELLALNEAAEVEIKTEQIIPHLQPLILVQDDLVKVTFTPQIPIEHDEDSALSTPTVPTIALPKTTKTSTRR